MRAIYDKVDTNGDGSVSPEELEAAIGGHDHWNQSDDFQQKPMIVDIVYQYYLVY